MVKLAPFKRDIKVRFFVGVQETGGLRPSAMWGSGHLAPALSGEIVSSNLAVATKINIMSRTYKKDRNGIRYKEGQYNSRIRYRCRCNYCTSNEKKRREEKILDKEILEYSSAW